MPVIVPAFGKINLGLYLGPPDSRSDGFHELRTVYQTVALSDSIKIDIKSGTGVEIKCRDKRVPQDESNTCWKAAERVMKSFRARGRVVITIEKNLPVQGGMGAGSSNAVATMIGVERALKQKLECPERMRIAQEIGSDVPLFLLGGTMLGISRGEQVFPLEDMPKLDLVIATPDVGVSTPKAFKRWDELFTNGTAGNGGASGGITGSAQLTVAGQSDKLKQFSWEIYSWLCGTATGVPAKGRDRAEALLLDLVRTGIENDFERVVFPQYPELRDVKRAVERTSARYVSLSGSGSTIYGIYDSATHAEQAAKELNAREIPAQATTTLGRGEYVKAVFGF
jgi:4-diphosphocytidyl-2-C-methyl-D-erythritol kinase